MKKIFIRIIVLTLLVFISIGMIFLGVGYAKYSNTLKEQIFLQKLKKYEMMKITQS